MALVLSKLAGLNSTRSRQELLLLIELRLIIGFLRFSVLVSTSY